MSDRARARIGARLAMGLMAKLPSRRMAIRGYEVENSLELELTHFMPGVGEPAIVPLLSVRGHAGARVAVLDRHGIDAAIDTLCVLREELDARDHA